MHDSHAAGRRLLVGLILFAAPVCAIALLVFARPAAADCPVGGCGGGGTVHQTFTHTLTVTRPSAGTVTSTPSGISCPAGGGGTCTVSQSQMVTCDELPCDAPTSGWDGYTLTAGGGPSGFDPALGGDCSGTPCFVTLDADRSVSLGWVDVTNPTVSLTSPAAGKVGPVVSASATASDNAGIASVKFLVDGVVKFTDSSAPYSAALDLSSAADGSSHIVSARATDTSNRVSDSSATVTVDKSVSLTVDPVDAVTSATFVPVSFTVDPDASVKCSVNGGTATACSGSYSPSLPSDGAYTYKFVAIDDVGNTASVTRSFVIDRTAPDAAFTDAPSEGAVVGSGPLTFNFDYSDATAVTALCSLDSPGFSPCADAHSQTLSGLAPGSSHIFRVRLEDAAGNVTDLVRHFSVAAAPSPPVVVTSGGSGSGASGAAGGSQGTAGTQQRLAKARLSSSFKLKGKTTMVRKLVVRGLANGARVRVRCKGHGCPFKSRSFRSKNGKVDLSKAFRGRRLARGARIEIDVALPGATKQVFKFTTRAHKKPLRKTA
jgi:hypothetical protein